MSGVNGDSQRDGVGMDNGYGHRIGMNLPPEIFMKIPKTMTGAIPDEHLDWWVRYNAYLKSPEWKAQHDRVLARDDHKCTRCGSDKRLQAHHTSYETYNEKGQALDEEIITLCFRCHRGEHRRSSVYGTG